MQGLTLSNPKPLHPNLVELWDYGDDDDEDDEHIHEDEHCRERFRKPSTTYLEYKGFNGVANYDVVLNSAIVCL